MSFVVDASVAIKWFVPEILHDKALALLYVHGGNLEAPDFILAEVSNIVWKKSRQGTLSDGQAEGILAETEECFAAFHTVPELSARALELALALGHPVYDCLYLTCAERTGRILVTADRKLVNAAEDTPFTDLVIYLDDVPVENLL